MVPGPAGTRCPECASLRASHLYKVNPLLLVAQTAVGVAAGLIGGFLVDAIGLFFFFIFFAAPAYGGAVAELMLRVVGRKRGGLVELIGTSAFVVGGILPILFSAIAVHSFFVILGDWRQLLGIGLAAGAVYGRLRYF